MQELQQLKKSTKQRFFEEQKNTQIEYNLKKQKIQSAKKFSISQKTKSKVGIDSIDRSLLLD